ncbi:MAG: peptide deformylase, partial [Myxococcaceae bacterium]
MTGSGAPTPGLSGSDGFRDSGRQVCQVGPCYEQGRMIREIRLWPDPVLRRKALPVEAVDASIRTLVNDMFETMSRR